MNNQKYWDELFSKIDSMSDEEFENLAIKLDKTDDIPFAIYDEGVELEKYLNKDFEKIIVGCNDNKIVYKKETSYVNNYACDMFKLHKQNIKVA